MRNFASEHLEQDHAKAVDVTGLCMGLFSQYLRRSPVQLLLLGQAVVLTCRLLVVVAQMISDLGLLSGFRLLIVLKVLADGVSMCRRMLGKGEVSDFYAPILVE